MALSCLLLTGCENALDKLKDSELFEQGSKCFEQKNYESAIKFLEHFENKFPGSTKIMESNYKRAIAYYSAQIYPSAIAAFELFIERYPTSDKVMEARRYLFFCYYNQVSRYDRNYDMVEKALQQAMLYREYYVEDKEFKEAFDRLQEFMVYYFINDMHLGMDRRPRAWIKSLWNISELLKVAPGHKLSAEAYYRLIEFLTCQNSQDARKDAAIILEQMEKNHAQSSWYIKAQAALKAAKPVDLANVSQTKILVTEEAENSEIDFDSEVVNSSELSEI